MNFMNLQDVKDDVCHQKMENVIFSTHLTKMVILEKNLNYDSPTRRRQDFELDALSLFLGQKWSFLKLFLDNDFRNSSNGSVRGHFGSFFGSFKVIFSHVLFGIVTK